MALIVLIHLVGGLVSYTLSPKSISIFFSDLNFFIHPKKILHTIQFNPFNGNPFNGNPFNGNPFQLHPFNGTISIPFQRNYFNPISTETHSTETHSNCTHPTELFQSHSNGTILNPYMRKPEMSYNPRNE
jgi:hypothetical protein